MIKSLSVMFSIYNESKRLKYCSYNIDKFNAASHVKNIEYTFVDNNNKDNSCILIEKLTRKKNKAKNKTTYKIIKNKI